MLVPTLGLANLKITEGETPVWKSNVYPSGILGLNGARVDTAVIAFGASSGDFHFTVTGTAH